MTKDQFNKKWPMTKIPDAIREVAVVWGDVHHWFIKDKVKLAQDILEATDKLMSERVKQQAIAFAKFINSYRTDYAPYWDGEHFMNELGENITTEQLYEKFLNTINT